MTKLTYQLRSQSDGGGQDVFIAMLDGKVSACGIALHCDPDSTFSVSHFSRTGTLVFSAPHISMPAAQAEALAILTERGEMEVSPNIYRCPVCGDDDHLDVVVAVSARLSQSDGEITGTEPHGDHEWDFDSDMSCCCGHQGAARDFRNPSIT